MYYFSAVDLTSLQWRNHYPYFIKRQSVLLRLANSQANQSKRS